MELIVNLNILVVVVPSPYLQHKDQQFVNVRNALSFKTFNKENI